MNKSKQQEEKRCPVCGELLKKVEHWEYDGITEYGSYEPYYDCINKCEEELEDSEIL